MHLHKWYRILNSYLWSIASTSDLLLPGNTLIRTSTGLLWAGEYGWCIWEGNCAANCWWYARKLLGGWWGGVPGLDCFSLFIERFSGASLWVSSSTSRSGSGLVVGSGDGVGTEEIVGCVRGGDCWFVFPSSWSESESSKGQSSTLILGRLVAVKKESDNFEIGDELIFVLVCLTWISYRFKKYFLLMYRDSHPSFINPVR